MTFDLPDSLPELEDELFKQESLLAYTLQQIASGRAASEKDAFIWEVSLDLTLGCALSVYAPMPYFFTSP